MSKRRHPHSHRPAPAVPASSPATPEAPPRTPFPAGLWVRRAMILVILAFGWYSMAFALRMLRADVYSQRGFSVHDRAETIALGEMRRARELAPHESNNLFRMASVITIRESSKLVRSGYRQTDLGQLQEALEMLHESEKSYYSSWAVILRAGQCSALLAEYFRQAGDAKQMRYYAGITANHYFAYSKLVGKPASEEERFYRAAMEYSLADARPQIALQHYDDYVYYFGDDAIKSPAIRQRAMESRQQMGEFHLMMFDLAELIWENPDNEQLLSRLETFSERYNQKPAARMILEELDRRGQLNGAALEIYQRLSE